MRIAYLTAGAAGMYCGTCMHDNTLASALIRRGHEVALVPTYTPMRTDEEKVAIDRIFFGAINVYLQQKLPLFRHTPAFLDWLLDRRALLNWVSRFASSTDAHELGALTLSMLEGERGFQRKELAKLVDWLERDLRPDLVHLSFSLFLGFAREIKRRLGVPVVCSLQGEDLFLDELTDAYRPKVVAAMRERAREVDAFTAPCFDYGERMAEELALGRERIHRARLGIKLAGHGDGEPRDPARGPVVGTLARICPEKGLHLLVDAFHELSARHPTARLRVAGFLGERDRAYFEEQRRRVASWGLESRVDFVGEVDREGKLAFLADLDVFALPTVYREPKGLPAIEALASGVPVVLPRHGAFPELVEATGGGLLVEPRSAAALAAGLDELLRDPERRRRLGRAGREATHRDYSDDATVEEHLAVYRRVLGIDDGEEAAS